MTSAPTITNEHMPTIVRHGDSGVESIDFVRGGEGFGVWRVNTGTKRNDIGHGYSGGGIIVWFGPQEGEPEYRESREVGEINLALPVRDRTDHWIASTVWDKHGFWIIAFLSLGLQDMDLPGLLTES